MLMGKSLLSGPKRGGLPVNQWVCCLKQGTRYRDSTWQSCADEAEASVLAALNEGVRGFHALNPNHWGERWQAVEKN
ncbi:hypothetical protein CXP47_24370 [Pseudomonas chlororaphis]|nr:hypothetical protein CXP47_24370 [Pseudomonas chlororaphis]KAB0535884.1 hypothetical protein F7R16_03110 [Pseudomonas chlororaphis subsp. aureofaciens]POA70764.1 hypothetical protein C1888_15030 [Pseudomonas sp. GW531-T4]PWY50399.1 hypothetical protein DK261_07670 [Pseudomonas sp. RW409]QFS58761.1 hypothetical protein FD951_20785 [Pseudomonas chlororaphis subsp. aurantiaca]TSD32782.1 hypothetical protein FCE86_003750 [Pseudomonas sp. ATCC 13985]